MLFFPPFENVDIQTLYKELSAKLLHLPCVPQSCATLEWHPHHSQIPGMWICLSLPLCSELHSSCPDFPHSTEKSGNKHIAPSQLGPYAGCWLHSFGLIVEGSVVVLTMEEMAYNHLNLTKTGLVIFVNAMSCNFFQKSIIPTKQKCL